MRALSSVYETSPAEMIEQPDFFNVAVQLETELDIQTFKSDVLNVIEEKLGRIRIKNMKNAPRTIDADIVLFNADVLDYDSEHHVPDPDLLKFSHIAIPMAELSPDLKHPETNETMKSICARLLSKKSMGNDPNKLVVKRPDIIF